MSLENIFKYLAFASYLAVLVLYIVCYFNEWRLNRKIDEILNELQEKIEREQKI